MHFMHHCLSHIQLDWMLTQILANLSVALAGRMPWSQYHTADTMKKNNFLTFHCVISSRSELHIYPQDFKLSYNITVPTTISGVAE